MTTMLPRQGFHTPAYRRQKKNSGHDLAFVRLDGKRVYLGAYDSAESRTRYHELISQWEKAGRILPSPPQQITIAEVAHQYLAFARTYYVKKGELTAETGNIILAIRPLLELFASLPASEFGPKRLKMVREKMIEPGNSRKYINKHVARIKRMFKWAVEEEIVRGNVYYELFSVKGLKKTRTKAPDYPDVAPAPLDVVEAVKAVVGRQVRAMIDLQLLTGARPGEIVLMRPKDVNRSEDIWIFQPHDHKNEHHDLPRNIFIGPKAQEIVSPFLLRSADAYCFSPLESEKERHRIMHEKRVTPDNVGHSPKPGAWDDSEGPIGPRYNTGSYRRAIARGIEEAFPLPDSLPKRLRIEGTRKWEKIKDWLKRMNDDQREDYFAWRRKYWWHPHQLRHNFGTKARKIGGLDGAQVSLGHAKADVTQVYAEADIELAKEVVQKIG